MSSKKWTTTPERARAVVASLPTIPRETSDAAIVSVFGNDACVIVVPSVFAARTLAVAAKENRPAKFGIYRPVGLRDACGIVGCKCQNDASDRWSDQVYELSGTHRFSSYYSPMYYRAYLAVAVAAGYVVPAKHADIKYMRIYVSCVLVRGNTVILADAPVAVKSHEPIGAIIAAYADGTRTARIGWNFVDHRMIDRSHTLPVSEIDAETNEDVRSWAIEHYAGPGTSSHSGWMRYLQESGASVLDERSNDIEGTHEALFSARDRSVLVATCPTGRLVALSTPPDIRNCADAQRWLHGGKDAPRIIGRT